MAKITIDNLVEALNAVANPEAKKEKEEKSIVTIDGKVCTDLMTEKEVRALALKLATTDAVIKQYAFVGNVEVDLPVAIPTAETVEEAVEAPAEEA